MIKILACRHFPMDIAIMVAIVSVWLGKSGWLSVFALDNVALAWDAAKRRNGERQGTASFVAYL